jgi:hypothetical protein
MAEPAATTDFTKDKKFYPDKLEFMEALQEQETVDPKSPEGALYYPKLCKIGGKIDKLLKDGNFPNLQSNKS